MPTSRYCDQAPASISASFSRIAAGDPGLKPRSSPPSAAAIASRVARARSGFPRARSSMTRSSSDRAKVTPAALIAWRSIGARRNGCPPARSSRGVFARISDIAPRRGPWARAERLGGRRLLAEVAHGRKIGAHVENAVGSDRDDGRSFDVRAPDPPGQRSREPIVWQRQLLRSAQAASCFLPSDANSIDAAPTPL